MVSAVDPISSGRGESLEFELTFLARALPEGLANWPSMRLTDVYVPANPVMHPRLRLRQKGEAYEITKKVPLNSADASAHTEITIPLSPDEYRDLAGLNGRRVEKIRYSGLIDGNPAEVDVFVGALQGLVLIDFEFSDREQLEKFVVPRICLADVTQEEFIAGGMLSGKGFADIESRLRDFGYEPI